MGVASPESLIPARMSVNALIYGQEYAVQGPAFTAYIRGMEKWIDLIMKYSLKIQTSNQVRTQLAKITEELGIAKKPIVAPEIFAQAGLFNTEVTAYLNEPMVVEALSQLADQLNRDFASLTGKKTFEVTKALKPLEVEGLGPCDAGFPIYVERSLPMVVALKGETEMELEQISGLKVPKTVRAKVVPAINMKFEMHMGVISPFTQEIIGTGLTMGGHLITPLEMSVARHENQVALNIKVAKEIQRELCMFHAAVTPFNFKKNLRVLAPISKAASINPIPMVHTALLPSTIRRSSIKVVFNPQLSKTKEVAILAGIVAKETPVVSSHEKARFCSKAMRQSMCRESLAKAIDILPQAPMLALKLDAHLVGSDKALNAAIVLGFKIESSTVKDILRMVTKIDLTTHLAPAPYEIVMTTSTKIPRVNILRNKEQLLQQALQVALNAQVELGYMTKPKEVVSMKTLMVKTESQRQAVRASPEFLRCTQEEQLGRPLSEVCELVRHQAASVDEVRTELVIPTFLHKLPIVDIVVPNIVNIAKTLFVGHLIETPLNHVSPTHMRMITKINRLGDEIQMTIEYNGRRYELINIRVKPTLLKGVLPISLRTPFMFVGLNRLARIPATCHVAPTHVNTFDRKTYNYQMNNCFHLLFRDCTEQIPVAVMARKLQGELKEAKILAGVAEVLMTPVSATDMKIQLNLNGQQQIVTVLPGEFKVIHHNGVQILHIQRYEGNVYSVHAVQENLMVSFDGKHAQIFGTPLLRGRSCGLCGDLDAEITADLKTPERCIMSRPRFAAYSYMIQESCEGIPSQDLALYQQDKTNCVKQEIIPTTL